MMLLLLRLVLRECLVGMMVHWVSLWVLVRRLLLVHNRNVAAMLLDLRVGAL